MLRVADPSSRHILQNPDPLPAPPEVDLAQLTASSQHWLGIGLWLVAFALMIAAASYQRLTGPTHPLRGSIVFEGRVHDYRLPRSGTTTGPTPIRLPSGLEPERASLHWRRFPSQDRFEVIEFDRHGASWIAGLPAQPAAGKVEYEVIVDTADGTTLSLPLGDARPVLRYKDPVPPGALIPHVVMMFCSMLLGVRAALATLTGRPEARWLVPATAGGLTVGGMILGPIVQKYAFGAYWTGWPLGEDLTDNKTLLMWAAWMLAAFVTLRAGDPRRRAVRAVVVAAVTVMLAVYLVPHSLRGSQLDYEALDAGVRPEDAIRTGRSEGAP